MIRATPLNKGVFLNRVKSAYKEKKYAKKRYTNSELKEWERTLYEYPEDSKERIKYKAIIERLKKENEK